MAACYPRRQQIRRLRRAGARALQTGVALTGALVLTWTDELGLASATALLAAALAFDGALTMRRARRSRVGAESEALVRSALEAFKRDGWRVQHSLDWPGLGDLDHVVRTPSGTAFMIETKTLRYTRAQLVLAGDAARWLARWRRQYPSGVRPVICLARGRCVERFEGDVLVVSLDRLVSVLRREAGRRSGRLLVAQYPRNGATSVRGAREAGLSRNMRERASCPGARPSLASRC